MTSASRATTTRLLVCATAVLLASTAAWPADATVAAGREQESLFTTPEGWIIELLAAEPEVINPVAIAVDARGRLHVSESHTYRYGVTASPVATPSNPIVRLDESIDGQLQRVVVASGFDAPVKGLAFVGGDLWATSGDRVVRLALDDQGLERRRDVIVRDLQPSSDPWGFYGLELGFDGCLYTAIGDHGAIIEHIGGQIEGRRGTGMVLRIDPGSGRVELISQGFRVPYAIEPTVGDDVWVASNGEAHPNRLICSSIGLDWHGFSRPSVDNQWLSGRHPFAPPADELTPGAYSQLLTWGDPRQRPHHSEFLAVNWGCHGPAGAHRSVQHVVLSPEGRCSIDEWLTCSDPHFRPSTLIEHPHGSLILADWYGRDDESDLTGRLWKLSRIEQPDVHTEAGLADRIAARAAITDGHRSRQLAAIEWYAKHPAEAVNLVDVVGTAPPGAACAALWALARGDENARASVISGLDSADASARRLAVRLAKRFSAPNLRLVVDRAGRDRDPAVRAEAALAMNETGVQCSALVGVLRDAAALDRHLRYRCAHALASIADEEAIAVLFAGDQASREAACTAIDIALFEQSPAVSVAEIALTGALATPALAALATEVAARAEPGTVSRVLARALEVLAADPTTAPLLAARAATAGDGPADAATVLERVATWLRDHGHLVDGQDRSMVHVLIRRVGPTPATLDLLWIDLRSTHLPQIAAARSILRDFGTRAAALSERCWSCVENGREAIPLRVNCLRVLSTIESEPDLARWQRALAAAEDDVCREAVRIWRGFAHREGFATALIAAAPGLLITHPRLARDLESALHALPGAPTSRSHLDSALAAARSDAAEAFTSSSWRGEGVFERSGCASCHASALHLGPPLVQGQPRLRTHVVESILVPDAVIHPEYVADVLTLDDGAMLEGLVSESGDVLRVRSLAGEVVVPRSRVVARTPKTTSLMPTGLTASLSSDEFADLIEYLIN